MEDYSYLDRKYFIDPTVYNCPYCNRNNVPYKISTYNVFDWTDRKECYVYIVVCSFCQKKSLHLSYEFLLKPQGRIVDGGYNYHPYKFIEKVDLDSKIFYSIPTSYFVLDDRIPTIVRELITESEGCLKMNFLTGASACMRKAVYELLVIEKADGSDYQTKIKSLKTKYSNVDPSYFDVLAHIQDMTSDKVHEQSWDKWDSKYLRLIIETLKSVLHDIFVLPQVKAGRSNFIQQLREGLLKDQRLKKNDGEAKDSPQAPVS